MRERSALLRLVLVGAQAATIAITWPLWQPRASPPELPLLPLPWVPFGAGLLLTLLVALVRPAAGICCHWLVLVLAIVGDQTREQPQVLSLALLLVATLPGPYARRFGGLQLAATWFWAGVGKLTSPRGWAETGTFLLGASPDNAPDAGMAALAAGASLGAAELVLGVLAFVPRTRPYAAALGGALHLGILVFLSPLGRDWNVSVWPWNVALAVAAVCLLRGEAQPLPAGVARTRLLGFAGILFVLLPIGFHIGVVDAPLAQQVYSGNTCRALVLRADGSTQTVGMLPALRVAVPPVPRIFLVWFRHHGGLGDRLVLTDDRALGGLRGPRERLFRFEDVR